MDLGVSRDAAPCLVDAMLCSCSLELLAMDLGVSLEAWIH